MPLTLEQSHKRYQQQAIWTTEVRSHLFALAGIDATSAILEVGCGTGAVIEKHSSESQIFGLDIDLASLRFAQSRLPNTVPLLNADAFSIPFSSRSFDVTFCHFLFLWLASPQRALTEMARVTRSGGAVIAFAEPDYGGRIDFPQEMERLGSLQIQSLSQQGADPEMGRKLASIFSAANLINVRTGVINYRSDQNYRITEIEAEWVVLISDLEGMINDTEVRSLKEADMLAWKNGERVLFVPTFYAIGIVP